MQDLHLGSWSAILPQGTQKGDLEGGQGLVDIRSKIKSFHLQARVQHNISITWEHTGTSLLRRAGEVGLDKELLLIKLSERLSFNWSLLTYGRNS